MLKRKMYWIAMGLVLSHLSIAKIAGTVPADCANCGNRPQAVEFPKPILAKDQNFLTHINENLHSSATGFTRGRGVGGGQTLMSQWPQFAAQPVATPESSPVFTQFSWPRYTLPAASSAQSLPGAQMMPASPAAYLNTYMSNASFSSALTAFGYSPASFSRMF